MRDSRMKLGLVDRADAPISCPSTTQTGFKPASFVGTMMLQSAIFADLQVNSFGIPTVRLTPALPLTTWAKGSFAQLRSWLRYPSTNPIAALSDHMRRDIGLDR